MADVKADDYTKLQKALKDPGLDKKVARAYRKRLREAAGPLGRLVLEKGVEEMPRRGGLQAYLLGRSPVAVSARSRGVDVWLGSKKKSQLSAINRRGVVRHPAFGHRDRKWSETPVPEAAFDRALEHLGPEAQQRLAGTITDILKELDLP